MAHGRDRAVGSAWGHRNGSGWGSAKRIRLGVVVAALTGVVVATVLSVVGAWSDVRRRAWVVVAACSRWSGVGGARSGSRGLADGDRRGRLRDRVVRRTAIAAIAFGIAWIGAS